MTSKPLVLLAVGDLILDAPGSESCFSQVAPVLQSADVVAGQVEVVFTSRGVNTFVDPRAAPPNDPKHMKALSLAGFDVATLAGNHIWDSGAPGIEDTIQGLKDLGIAAAGAGMNLEGARAPAIVERDGTRFGFLSYNCVGPIQTWATPQKPGCAYVHVITHYEMHLAIPGGPPTIYSFPEPQSLKAMTEDIRKLRSECDVLVVCLHKGIVYIPAKLAMYECAVSYAAIDAGADLVLGHHAHILKGIEVYKGKPIFHGMNHFVWTAMDTRFKDRPPSLYEQMGLNIFGDFYDGRPNPEEKRMTMIAKCVIEDRQISRVTYLPCMIDGQGQPEVLKPDAAGQQVFQYMETITRAAGLNAQFQWDGDEVLISSS
ncbi:MAG: CapA family protein [Chloroflexi bacterium]|nr:CapA family protein [Chloroflexota bacterium]